MRESRRGDEADPECEPPGEEKGGPSRSLPTINEHDLDRAKLCRNSVGSVVERSDADMHDPGRAIVPA